MVEYVKKTQIEDLKKILKDKNIKITEKKVCTNLNQIVKSQEVFPLLQQRALLVQLLNIYDKSKKKEVILLEELQEETLPVTVVLGALAEDWPGMSNSILGIVHHHSQNVLFIKGFTVEYEDRTIGMVILAFKLKNKREFENFRQNKKVMLTKIKDASIGSRGKSLLLEDETVKFEIYNEVIKKVASIYDGEGLNKISGEDGEALKFISSRSRDYLEDRNINDLAGLIIDNYNFQTMIRKGQTEEIIKISNINTKYEKLTGITFACKERLISIEDFLKTLDFLVPAYIIKHHKSFVSGDGILVYRIEIVDRYGAPLKPQTIKSIEKSLEKLILTSASKKFTQYKTIGGFEHFARAVIPFLMGEVKRTGFAQVYINADKRTDFSIDIKLFIVSYQAGPRRLYRVISELEKVPGIEINSIIPPKIYSDKIEINILKLNINLSEFATIADIFKTLRELIGKVYGKIRDFDQGFREIDIRVLSELREKLSTINMSLIRDIFFNFDELYRIEMPFNLLYEVVKLCAKSVDKAQKMPAGKVIFNHKTLRDIQRTICVVSLTQQQKILSQINKILKGVTIYFTKIEWNQRNYFLLIMNKDNKAVGRQIIKELRERIQHISRY
jgi:hypothetical protein